MTSNNDPPSWRDDPDVLTEFLAWRGTLLGHRGVPPLTLDAGLRVAG